MQAIADAGALVAVREHVERREIEPALRELSPQLFERAVRRRTHDGAVLAVALLLVSALLGLGVWIVTDVAGALELARYCDGKCIAAPR
jgi:hypothetical protein